MVLSSIEVAWFRVGRDRQVTYTRACMKITSLALMAILSSAEVLLLAQAPDPSTLGPKVGERVPEFSLPDQRGVNRSLESILGPKGAVLVFFRSADW